MFRRTTVGVDPVGTGPDPVRYGLGGRIGEHAVTEGINAVATFLGSAFRVNVPHAPLLVLGPPVQCWGRTDLVGPVDGYLQGALLETGDGRVAVFGEAAMFTAQLNIWASTKMGMNNPIAEQNSELLLNVLHWLTDRNE